MFNRMTWIAMLGLTGALAGGAGCVGLDETEESEELGELGASPDFACGVPAGNAVDPDLRIALEEEVLAADTGDVEGEPAHFSPWCAPGWHEHVVVWPKVGRANGPCNEYRSTIPLGRHVCMLNTSATVCGGQGWTQVYLMETEVPDNWLWSRTEAFNGH